MVVMRLDEETAKVMDPAKGSRRKQSKPNRVSLVDQPPIDGQQHAAALLSSDPKPEVDDADLPQTSGLQEGVHGEVGEGDDISTDHEEYEDSDVAAHLSEACAARDYSCHYCGRSFSSRESLDQHEHDAHLSADAEHSDVSGEFPTAYHRLASEFAQQTKGGLVADAPVGTSHEAMEAAPDADTEASGGTPQLLVPGVFHPEAYCEICQREFCNKYFLKTHKANIHGIVDSGGSSTANAPKAAATPPRTNPIPEREYAVAVSIGGANASPATSSSAVAASSPAAPAMLGSAATAAGGAAAAAAASAAAAAAAAVAAGMNKEMYSGVISSGGDICDICQKPFRNKYYIKRHKLHVHGVASPTPGGGGGLDRVGGGGGSAAAGYADSVQPRPSPDGAAMVVGAAAQPGSSALLAEGASDGANIADSLVGCNMCTRKFSSMHAVKIHRASAHGVYARDLAAAAAAAAGLSTPTGRGLSSLLLADAAAVVGANGSAVGAIVGRIDRPAGAGDHAAASMYKRAPGGAIGNMAVAGLYPATAAASLAAGAAAAAAAAATGKHGSSTFESPSRAPTALAAQVGPSAGQLPLVTAHGLAAGDAAAGTWHGTLPSSNGPNVPAPIIALTYHGSAASVSTAAAAGTADGEAGQVLLLLPQPLSSEVKLDAKDVTPVNCDLCQKSFGDVHHLRAHKLTAHSAADASSLELSATADAAAAAAAGGGPVSLPFASGYGGPPADGAASGSVATEYKQWRWKEHANQTRVYCDICNKELCNKYFLRTHKWKKHGIGTTPDGAELLAPTASAGATAAAAIAAAAAAASAGAVTPAAASSPRGRVSTGQAVAGLPQAAASGVGFEPSAVDTAADAISQRQQQQYAQGSFDPDSEGPDHSSASSGLSSGNAEGTSPEGRAAAGGDAGPVSSHAIACHFCGSEFSDLQAAVAHACEQSAAAGCGGGGGGVPLDGSGAAASVLLPPPDGDELKGGGGGGSGSLPLGALLGMQKFSWKSRGGRTATSGGGGSASTGEKLYSCSRCDYKTPWLSNIYSHEQRKHGGGGGSSARGSGAAPHTCTVCLRTFSYEHSLMRHMADYHNGTGSGGSVIVTTSGPGGAAGVGSIASVTPGAVAWPRRHQRSRCPYCNKQFVNKLLCQSHIRTVHGNASTAALTTGSSGADGTGNGSNGYTVIRAGATGYKVYACDRCGLKCRTLSNLRMHQLVKHMGLTVADASVHGCSVEPELMDTAESIADASSATGGVKEEALDGSGDALTNGSAGALLVPPSMSVHESLPGVSMQPFVIESVDGASEFACASVHLPVYKQVNGRVQVTLTLRPIVDL